MGWFSSGAECVGDKRWKCWYERYDNPYAGPSTTKWCRDYEDSCPSQDSGGYLVSWEDQRPPQQQPPPKSGGW
jgi:hypothetical protein